MGPGAERAADTGDGDGRCPAKGLVAVRRGPCLESHDLLPNRSEAVRLSGVRGSRAAGGAAEIPGGGEPSGGLIYI